MSSLRIAAAVLVIASTADAADANVRVIVLGDVKPGVYGRVEIGTVPVPPLVYERPLVASPAQRASGAPPIYLHVPPGHAKSWSKHCHKYNACSQPVYFVFSDEYKPKEKKPKKEK
jgi:hypothetical protein